MEHPVRRWTRRGSASTLITCTVGLLVSLSSISGTPAAGNNILPAEREMAEFLWDRDTTIRGMITVTYAYASDSDGPSTQGIRIGYGYLGGKKNDYPWGEFWATLREDGDYEITAAGLSVVPVSKLSRRFGLGPLFDLGLSRRQEGGRSVYAGLIGAGAEGVVRISRRCDLVTTAEAVYRTTGDVELQARAGIRFHHQKIPFFRRGP